METTTHPQIQQAFSRVKALVVAYGALGAAGLVAVVILAGTGHPVTGFMWGRSAGVFASAAVAFWLTGIAARGERGARGAYLRMRIISAVVPLAIVIIDVAEGGLPSWFLALQIGCAVVLAPSAFIINGARLRANFPKSEPS
jgi:hypothetical protein